MSSLRLLTFCSLVTVFILTGCNSGGNGRSASVPTDVVSNPNSATGKSDLSSLPVIQFEETEHDFGRILEGETVSFSFKFKNTGKSELVIADVTTSCGCTVPSYPKTPLQPGEKGIVKVAFNSIGKRGFQSKNILVVANTQPNTTMLRIKAQVVNARSE
ncbi:MAG: DUF1573 domain-containing protein [Bacteroidales bacterium]|nr:DUF1573 domain-containing protein [Bacteroidales bacterium]